MNILFKYAILACLFFSFDVSFGGDFSRGDVSITVCVDNSLCDFYGDDGIHEAKNFVRGIRVKYGCNFNINVNIHPGFYRIRKSIVLDSEYDGGCGKYYTLYSALSEGVIFSGAKRILVRRNYGVGYIDRDSSLGYSALYYNDVKMVRQSIDGSQVQDWISGGKMCGDRICNGILSNILAENFHVNYFGGYVVANKEFQSDILRIKNIYNHEGHVFFEINDYDWGKMAEQKFPKSRVGERIKVIPGRVLPDVTGWAFDGAKIIFNNVDVDHVDVGDLESIFDIGGSNVVKNIKILGINFYGTSWSYPSNGYIPRQAMAVGWSNGEVVYPSGAINMNSVVNLDIIGCRFFNLGGFGIVNKFGAKYVKILNNIFKNIDGGAIYVASDVGIKGDGAGDEIRIENNDISNIGLEYYSSVAIFSGYASNLVISGNKIKNTPYSAISVGWGWSKNKNNMKNNKIVNNVIDSSMLKLSDGGAIYLLSRQDGTVVEGNTIINFGLSADAVFRFASAIYLDAGVYGVKVGCNYFYGFNKGMDKDVHKYFNQAGNELNEIKNENDCIY